MEPILTAENLTKVYHRNGRADVTALDHVSFAMKRGECLGIIGESGSGKSTLASLITRLQEPTDGRIFLEGKEITHLRGKELRLIYRRMQMIFQAPAESFNPRRTLGDGIGESLFNLGMPRQKVRTEVEGLLERCGLPKEFADRYPHEVSGGQCQRAAIARALAVNPELLICDEATSALDVTIQKEITELLKALQKRSENKLSILFISHDIALIQELCGRVLVMHWGRIVEEGIPDEIVVNPRDEYTKQLIDSVL